jgi:hypothetical protein
MNEQNKSLILGLWFLCAIACYLVGFVVSENNSVRSGHLTGWRDCANSCPCIEKERENEYVSPTENNLSRHLLSYYFPR